MWTIFTWFNMWPQYRAVVNTMMDSWVVRKADSFGLCGAGIKQTLAWERCQLGFLLACRMGEVPWSAVHDVTSAPVVWRELLARQSLFLSCFYTLDPAWSLIIFRRTTVFDVLDGMLIQEWTVSLSELLLCDAKRTPQPGIVEVSRNNRLSSRPLSAHDWSHQELNATASGARCSPCRQLVKSTLAEHPGSC
jgi:hypothetical protein